MVVVGTQRQVGLCEFNTSLLYKNEFQASHGRTLRPCLKKSVCGGESWRDGSMTKSRFSVARGLEFGS